MNEFEKIVVTDLSTFQFKPDMDVVLVTENNIKALEKIFKRLEYRNEYKKRVIERSGIE